MKYGGFLLVVFAVCAAASCQPAHASKARELADACKANPTHQVCVALAEKKAKSKVKRDAKLQAQIEDVTKGN